MTTQRGGMCHACEAEAPELIQDFIVGSGSRDDRNNWQLLCAACYNLSHGSKE